MTSNGLKETLAAMERVRRAPREKIKPVLVKQAGRFASAAKTLAETSRDTGALIDSIEVTPPGQTTPLYSQPGGSRVAGEFEAIVTAGNSAVRYPHLVEFGTSKTEAQPFWFPALRLTRKAIQSAINRGGRKIFRDAWKGKP
ncbi:MAG: HK97 gp10 family phage protein [Mesorhizobium sp.]|nr:HK97 gp10 family phage protein [Mesorhizobium sp.]